MSTPRWFKSSFSEASGNACVEVCLDGWEGVVAVRDSGRPARVVVADRPAFAAFVAFAALAGSGPPGERGGRSPGG
ncbi:hypothetical protein GCM10010387_48550 [Streptomyces inusitatus]|uniref:DUF397 domain-containing protein n=1 Tax=Streptomyces inusitatus TaxID=68221 RepID=A0A918QIR6_9ACTN|nr:DUF397 domain-containing protein [Streptomyces inusitatus]GGZ48513.1 hypothetical protein GCM10010387_48550 [Streptomyces inusitatus]